MKFAGVIVGGTLLLLFTAALRKSIGDAEPVMNAIPMQIPNHSNIGLIQNLGWVLFKDYVFPFEAISILILSAMIGAVVLGKKEKIQISE